MLILNKSLLPVFLLLAGSLVAQPMPKQATLLFPINPGTPNTLAGTMGELRSSHFHTGIDIRTGGQEGVSVLAADDGYIFRISVKPGGYGNTIYIKHPSGHTTVYAHLKSFRKDIAEYVRNQQYLKKKFAINLFPKASAFRVNQGETIALSGNSGSSGGPHLHFDVRNRNQDLLNPLNYGFDEIVDFRPPLAKELALVTSNKNSLVNGEFGRIEIPFEKNGSNYVIKDTISAIGRIGLELFAYDRMNNTRFKTGINKIKISVNNSINMVTNIDTWPFSKARQYYTYINYEALANYGKRFHKLYIDNGNHLGFYSTISDQGFLNIKNDEIYSVEISLTDSYENESLIHFVIKGGKETQKAYKNTVIPSTNWRIHKNSLIIKTTIKDTVKVFTKGLSNNITPNFTNSQYDVYVWDLGVSIPDSILVNNEIQKIAIKGLVPAGIAYKLYDPIADIQFAKNTLFQDRYLALNSKLDSITGNDIVSIGSTHIPLNKSYSVNFKPSNVPDNKKYWRVYSVWGKSSAYIGGTWKEDQINFSSRTFGKYTLMADSIGPTIKPLIINNNELVFKITDNLSGISTYNMYLNNEWVLMNYDPKKNIIWAEKPREDYLYKGKLVLKIRDNTGNESTHSTQIN